MIDPQKLIEAAEHHIKRGDSMAMDPKVVKELAQSALECQNKQTEPLQPDFYIPEGASNVLRIFDTPVLKTRCSKIEDDKCTVPVFFAPKPAPAVAVNEQMLDCLEVALAGLSWYHQEYPLTVEECDHEAMGRNCGVTYVDCTECDTSAKLFRNLWQSISGPGSWNANPWVWVIEFKRVQS
jgi:hypothetical protein